nr:MAG TPA: hypothetical protein [Caudoviricetes sp.]
MIFRNQIFPLVLPLESPLEVSSSKLELWVFTIVPFFSILNTERVRATICFFDSYRCCFTTLSMCNLRDSYPIISLLPFE